MSASDCLNTFKDKESVGVVNFSPVTFTTPGVYNFTIRELTPSGDGWTTDKSVYPVIVTVTADQTGQLVARADYPEGKPTFVNTYKCKPCRPAKACLRSEKIVCGACIGKNKFEFTVFDKSGIKVAQVHNNQNGDVEFPPLTFDKSGTYNYTIKETAAPSDDWTMDKRTYPVVIKVHECDEKRLIAKVCYPEGFPVFKNKYVPKCHKECKPCCCNVCLPCCKCSKCKSQES